jgi:hypothetical protein
MKKISCLLAIVIVIIFANLAHSTAMLTYTFDDGGKLTLNAFDILNTQVSHPQHMSNSLITISIVSKTSPNLAEAGRDRWSLFTVAARNWRK